LPAMTY